MLPAATGRSNLTHTTNSLLLKPYEVQQLILVSAGYGFLIECQILSNLKSKGVPPEDKQYTALLNLLKAQIAWKSEQHEQANSTSTGPQPQTIGQQLRAYKQSVQSSTDTSTGAGREPSKVYGQGRVGRPVTLLNDLTLDLVAKEAQERKNDRINYRLNQLEGVYILLSSEMIATHFTFSLPQTEIIQAAPQTSTLRIKAEIEKKSLLLLPLQYSLKQTVSSTMVQTISLQAIRDPAAFKRSSLLHRCEVFIPTEYTFSMLNSL